MTEEKRCMFCGHIFRAEELGESRRCPECGARFVELVDGPPITKNWHNMQRKGEEPSK